MQNTIDQNKYEDFIRFWLGSKSYLLLSMDKIFSTTTKSLMNIAHEETCSRSFKMHEKFHQYVKEEEKEGEGSTQWWQHESVYMSNFFQSMQEVNNFNNIVIRLMYSSKSKIMSIHYF